MKYEVEEISKKIKRKKIFHNITRFFVILFLTFLLIVNLIMFYQTEHNPEKIPSIYNISILNIVSHSMEPTINVNDLIFIKYCTAEELKEGDIITYRKENESIVTHRIVDIEENEKIEYTTKGDNNNAEDDEKIQYDQVCGKYLFKIEKAGKFVEILQKGNGIISIIIIILIFVVLKNTNDKKREGRKKIREKYEIKKKREEYAKTRKNEH